MGPHVAVNAGASRYRWMPVSMGVVTSNRFPSNLTLEAHSHPNATVAVILRGGFAGTYRAGERDCVARTVIVEPAGEAHANRFGPGETTILTISLASDRLVPAIEAAARRFQHAIDPHAEQIARRAARELDRPDDVSPLAVEGAAMELLARVTRAGRGDGRAAWILDARALLHDRYADALSIGEIADAVGVQPERVARGFRRAYGEPLATYLRRIRVDAAAHLLATTDLPISRIAADVGFADQSHLTRCFTRFLGTTPGRYRAEQRPRSGHGSRPGPD